MRRLGIQLGVAVAGVLAAADAHAAPGADVPLHVQFAPDSACIDEDALGRDLRGRGLRMVAPGEQALYDVKVQARPTGPGYEATMVLMTLGESPAVRVISAASCDEVWSTFALALALALSQLPDGPAPPVAAPPSPPPSPAPAPVAAPEREKTTRFDVAGLWKLNFGVTPKAAMAFGLAAEMELWRDKGMYASRARLGGFVIPAQGPSGQGAYALQAAELGFCPLRWFRTVVVRPCASLEVGRLQASSDGLSSGELHSTLWMALKGGLSARWEPVQRFFLEAEAAVGTPFTRPSFKYNNAEIFEVPVIVGHGGILAGVLFP